MIALFGQAQLQRVWCKDCGSFSFVRDGVKVCCGEHVEVGEPTRYIRESEPYQMRRPPSTYEREQALERQDGKCFYCNQPLGAVRTRNGREVTLRTHWDHLMPYAYDQNNSPDNFVAACHVCNGIKSSHVFKDMADARVFLSGQRAAKGYDF